MRDFTSAKTLGEVLRFGIVGLMNVAINAVVYAALVFWGAHYIAASAVGTALGILNSFIWSKFFVFRRPGSTASQFTKTLLVYAVQIVISWGGLAFWIEIIRLDPYVAYALNVLAVTAASFLGLKFFAFRSSDAS